MHRCLLAAVLAALAAGCSSYYSDRYVPDPADAAIAFPDEEDELVAHARVLAVLRGVRKADRSGARPLQVEFTLRIENLGEAPLEWRAEELTLLSGDLVELGPAAADPAEVALPPGESGAVELAFPIPPGLERSDLDWNRLNLRWTLHFGPRFATTSVTFERVRAPFWAGGGVAVTYNRF